MINRLIFALALMGVATPAFAQNVRVSDLPAAAPLSGTEKIPAAQTGTTVAVTPNQIVTLAGDTFQPKDPDLTAIAALTTTPTGRDVLTAADAAAIRTKAGVVAIGASGSASDLTSGTVPAARMPAFTGDVTSSAGSVALTIANDSVSNAKLANVATGTIRGRVTAGTGDPEDLTGTQATTLLDTFTSGLKGLAPASGGGTANYLRADGTWATPPVGTGTVTSVSVVSANGFSGSVATATTTPAITLTLTDPELSSIAGLTSAADKVPYYTGSGTASLADLTSTARTLLDDTSVSAMRTTLGAAANADIQIFDASGTWNKPTGAKVVRVIAFGAGGGGGGGARQPAGTATSGGGGGGGGMVQDVLFDAGALGSSVTVTIGAAGTGGTGATTDAVGGNGGQGGATSFGANLFAYGGGGGAGGQIAANAGGGGGPGFYQNGGSSTNSTNGTAGSGQGVAGNAAGTFLGGGGAQGNNGAAGSTGGASGPFGSAGGGSGGGISAANATSSGGGSGRSLRYQNATPPQGGAAGVAGNTAASVVSTQGSVGGGGGGSSTTADGGAGGAGQAAGGGGGGGGSAQTGFNGGNGAAGGQGRVIVVTSF